MYYTLNNKPSSKWRRLFASNAMLDGVLFQRSCQYLPLVRCKAKATKKRSLVLPIAMCWAEQIVHDFLSRHFDLFDVW
jgi:hypothetical protein